MNKIRKYLIHLLGGVTDEENDWSIKCAIRETGASASKCVLLYMKICDGLQPDEWCKNIYEYTCKRCEAAFKKFNEYAESINHSKNIL